MADRPLAVRLGHFLPYLLRRRLQAVLWPADAGDRTASVVLLLVTAAYGTGFGFLLNLSAEDSAMARLVPKFVLGLYAFSLSSGPLVDFLPALRRITRPLPEHFPVSARLCAVTAFLLDFMTLRRLTLVAGVLAMLAVTPRHAAVPVLALLLLLATAVVSFNVRFLVSIGRWRHPLLLAHMLSFGLLVGWVSRPELPQHTALGVLLALLPWGLAAVQLRTLGPYFAARFLPETHAAAVSAAPNSLMSWLLPEQRAYLRRTWGLLLMGLGLKVLLMGLIRWIGLDEGKLTSEGYFYLALVPLVGFTYVNNNVFGFMRTLAANELQRLGLTRRLLLLYLRVVLPVVLADCLLTVVLLLALFPPTFWPRLATIPLGAVALTSVGLWSSLYHSKTVASSTTFSNINKNNSRLMSFVAIATAAALYFLPWWWARVVLTGALAASTIWPIRALLRNDGRLRRRLWQGIGA
ncbi:MAG TPA: hypothetical protein VF629_20715 [Hymenobacter sp.]|jgi:hypothetical protein|uniref:hypothetical protein n=1 Tax=Hymenobacter sp. TaxID=1898978 RepID=UPI002ED89640